MILSTKQFNKNQDIEYKKYCDNCISNRIEPEKQSRYFPKIGVNYGYVYTNNFNEIYWKKRKKDFNI